MQNSNLYLSFQIEILKERITFKDIFVRGITYNNYLLDLSHLRECIKTDILNQAKKRVITALGFDYRVRENDFVNLLPR